MEAFCRLPSGKILAHTQLNHLAVGSREERNYLQQQGKGLLFLGRNVSTSLRHLHSEFKLP